MDKWIKPLGLLAFIILVCSVLVRVLTNGETLSEYADTNPDIAYATPAPTPSVSPMPEATAQPFGTPESSESIHYEEGFFYQPLTDDIIARITGISYPVSENEISPLVISYEDLRYLNVLYYDFNGEVQSGELICNQEIAHDLVEIFYELYRNEYQIEKIRLIDEYGGDDTASMLDNNTSCFNYRVVDGTDSLSKHAIGCAIDINPFYNPYVVFNKDGSGKTYISPEGSEIYADRSQNFPYKIDENDLCYKLFKEHGFTWGGDWNSCKDYQHFQKVIQ
ncbi:MAG: M15 family metallopeptidase [Lachnospiraceae bacterium]|nr:M15 family metallopeptidase [Lachnospiraceae bacterium]